MQVAAPGREELRELAEIRLERPLVASLYLDLDPREFATPPARATAARSLLDEADRRLREQEGLTHEDRMQLQSSLQRLRRYLERELSGEAAHAVALFAAEPVDLFEAVKLPRSVRNRVAFGRSPLIAPLAALERRERWCVALVNRKDARVLRGSPDELREVESVREDVHGQHDQGGWSQARYQRHVDKEAADHLRHAADLLLRQLRRRPFDHLLIGGPQEVAAEFESKLHPYLAERVAGRVDVDVENASAEQVLGAARGRFDELEERAEREALERLEEGSRAAAGVENVLRPLNERRVEALLLDEQFRAPGRLCSECGWLGPEGEEACPAHGAPLQRVDDVTEPAIEAAVRQDARVLPMRHRRDALQARGGIAALLRF